MIKLIAATPGDAEPLARIMATWINRTAWMPKLHSPSGHTAFLRRLIAHMQVTIAVDDVPTGFLARDNAEIPALYVASAARGQGVGKALLDHAKSQSPHLHLWTFQANTRARAFYAREGFTETRLTDGVENEERLPDAYLEWSAS